MIGSAHDYALPDLAARHRILGNDERGRHRLSMDVAVYQEFENSLRANRIFTVPIPARALALLSMGSSAATESGLDDASLEDLKSVLPGATLIPCSLEKILPVMLRQLLMVCSFRTVGEMTDPAPQGSFSRAWQTTKKSASFGAPGKEGAGASLPMNQD